MEKFISGFVAIVGRPNVGKSTLVNSLIGEKIAIMSDKPQTTRNKIMCVLTNEHSQIIFLDTPGIHKPQHKLGEFMVNSSIRTLKEVDTILFVVDVTEKPGKGEEYILNLLSQVKTPVILVLNKVDTIKDKGQLLPIIQSYQQKQKFVSIVPLSALKDEQFDNLITEIEKQLPEGPLYYDEDTLTDQTERVIAAEMIREKALRLTRDEIPHAIAVEVEEMKTRPNNDVYIRAVIYVERDSQKAIIIGEKGGLLKKIGQQARTDIEGLLGQKVFLDLWVKVMRDWRNQDKALRGFGFKED